MRIFLARISQLFGVSAQSSPNNSVKGPGPGRGNRWLKGDSPYNELDEVEGSLSGDTVSDTHNNTIATELRRPLERKVRNEGAEDEDSVTKDVAAVGMAV